MGLWSSWNVQKNITYILAAESLIHTLTQHYYRNMMGTFLKQIDSFSFSMGVIPVNGLFSLSGSTEEEVHIGFICCVSFLQSVGYNAWLPSGWKTVLLLQSDDRTGEKNQK